jgi:glutaredoxin
MEHGHTKNLKIGNTKSMSKFECTLGCHEWATLWTTTTCNLQSLREPPIKQCVNCKRVLVLLSQNKVPFAYKDFGIHEEFNIKDYLWTYIVCINEQTFWEEIISHVVKRPVISHKEDQK